MLYSQLYILSQTSSIVNDEFPNPAPDRNTSQKPHRVLDNQVVSLVCD